MAKNDMPLVRVFYWFCLLLFLLALGAGLASWIQSLLS